MSKVDDWLEVIGLMTISLHEEEVASVRTELNANWKRRQDSDKSARAIAEQALVTQHKDELAAKVEESFRAGLARGQSYERESNAKRIRDEQEAAALKARKEAEERAKWLLSPMPVGFTERVVADLRADVAARLEHQPESKQWEMILADAPATYVIAGAGSGKSTSLVLRVIGLNQYVGIDRSQISVFTFTRDSRKDFIKKLISQFAKWGVTLSEPEAKGLVRTFHSMVLRMGRATIPNLTVLELIDREKKGPVKDIDVENLLELKPDDVEVADNDELEHGVDNDFDPDPEDDDSHAVDNYLRLAYERAFTESEEFYELVLKLFKLSFTQVRRATDEKTPNHIKWISEKDEELTKAVDKKWRDELAPSHWPLDGIDDTLRAINVSSQVAERFWVNGYVPQLDAYVVLGGAQHYRHVKYSEVPSSAIINSKRKLLAAISEKPIIWIDTIKQLTNLRSKLRWLAEHDGKRHEALIFSMVAPGDFKSRPILKGFYGLAQFVENLGLPVSDTLSGAQSTAHNRLWSDVIFMRATAIFWEYFEALLEEDGVYTFNQLFARFSEDRPEELAEVPSSVLVAMKHLMIDEFQDVSPQIVKWVRGCQRELVKRGMAGSLTCIGDDYQSIYGWRGSSPEFFVKFEGYFPAADYDKIILEDNFRSSDNILRCAESVLVGYEGDNPKTSYAKSKWADEPIPVSIKLSKDELPYNDIRQHISAEVGRVEPTEKNPMLVLARSKKTHEPLSKSPLKSWGKTVQFMTFHGAKGLEARSVVLLGDCNYFGTNPVKNYLYEKAGLGSYDVAQQAESRRVAYVGITRAMEACSWYAVKKDNGAIGAIPQGRSFVRFD
jgi:superfamily I DNA/RNA helicase